MEWNGMSARYLEKLLASLGAQNGKAADGASPTNASGDGAGSSTPASGSRAFSPVLLATCLDVVIATLEVRDRSIYLQSRRLASRSICSEFV